MALATITEWLSGSRDYSSGLKLLESHSDNSFLLKILSKGPSAFNQKKLIEELNQLNEKLQDKPETIRFNAKSDAVYLALPDQVKDLKKKRDDLYKEASFLHSRLLDVDDKQCGIDAFRIEEIFDEIDDLHEKLDYYAAHNKLPEEAPLPVIKEMTEAEMKLRLATLRTYRSKGMRKHDKEFELLSEKLKQCHSSGLKK